MDGRNNVHFGKACWKIWRKKLKLQKQRALSKITFQNTEVGFVQEKSPARTRASVGA